jgi:hypothetical protein
MQYRLSILAIHLWVILVATSPAHRTPEPIQWVDCSQNVPQYISATYPTLNTSAIPPNLKCGNLVVPMDYAKPVSSYNNITVSLAMYRPTNPKGVVF